MSCVYLAHHELESVIVIIIIIVVIIIIIITITSIIIKLLLLSAGMPARCMSMFLVRTSTLLWRM